MEALYDIFISYQSIDESFANQLVQGLKKAKRNIKIFFAPLDIRPDENIVLRIDEGLSKARFFALILSPEYLSADWTTAERSAAIYNDPSGRLGRIIPVMFRKCQLPPLLRFRKYIDVKKLGLDTAIEQMIHIISPVLVSVKEEREDASKLEAANHDMELVRQLLDSLEPDYTPDMLYTNIFPLKESPKFIWSAPTEMHSTIDIFRYFGRDAFVPPFITYSGRIYTFVNLKQVQHPFTGVVEEYDTKQENIDSWARDEDHYKMLLWLYDDCLREKAREMRMAYERKGKRYYYEKGVLKVGKFKAFAKGQGRGLIIDYTEKGGNFVAHRAVSLRFILLGMSPFLRIEPGWIFKNTKGDIITGKRRIALNAKFTSRQRNASNFNELRFWSWFLSDDDHLIKLEIEDGKSIFVDAEMHPIEVDFGILGDKRDISPTQAPPDLIFDEETDIEDHLEDLDDMEDDDVR